VTNREFGQLMNRVKDAPELGGGFAREGKDAGWMKICDRLGFDYKSSRVPLSVGWKEYVSYYRHRMSELLARPLAVSASAFALVFGGWVTTVNASFDSLPGDALYPVKLATERMQITLATSGEQKARLHAEFAARRLQEVGAITSSSRLNRGVELRAAVDGFKAELASANEQLAVLGANDPSLAVDLAVTLDRKADEYHAILTQASPSDASAEEKSEVADAQTAVQETNTAAIDTLVSANESGDNELTSVAIEKNFQDMLTDVRARIALTVARIGAIKGALAASGTKDADLDTQLAEARQQATSHEKEINQAMNTYAAGGLRSAFDQLTAVSDAVAEAEEAVTGIEIDISTHATDDPPPPAL
jgi:hypothetical protein